MRMNRSVAARIALAVIIALCAGLWPQAAVRAADPYEINVVLPLTGFAAFIGQGEAKTFAVIEEVVNKHGGIRGRPVKFVIADDQSSPQVAVQLTNGFIAKNVPIVFGSTISAMCQAQAALIKNGPVVWCFSPVPRPPAGSFMFVTFQTTEDYIEACIRYAKGRGLTKLGLIATTDASGQDFDSSYERAIAKPEFRNMSAVAHEHFNITDLSAAAQIARIKTAGAQYIVSWVTGTALGTLLRAGIDAGLDLPVCSTPANLAYAQLRGLSAVMPSNLLFPATAPYAPNMLAAGPAKQAVFEYLDALRSHGIQPDQGTLAPWSPALIAIEALRKYGTTITAEQMRAYIAGYKGTGVLGDYNFPARPQRGVDASTVLIARWDKARDSVIAVSKFGGEPLR